MSVIAKIDALVPLIAGKLNDLNAQDGDLTALQTTVKTTLVEAINENKAAIDAATAGGLQINDAAAEASTVWSGQKTDSEITSRIAAALEGEDLSDIAAQITALMQADNGLVSAVAAQTFDATQQAQARSNIGAASQGAVTGLLTRMTAAETAIGDESTFDPVADFNAAINF